MGNSFTRLLRVIFGHTECRALMVGLDGAGKTTILYHFKLDELVTTIPTVGFNVETVEYKHMQFTVWDIGGQDKIRALWRLYYQETDAIIFVVDSNDRERCGEAKNELFKLLREAELETAALLVLANKKDLPGVMTTTEVTEQLGLLSLTNRRWYIQATSALTGSGLYEGLDWISHEVKRKKRNTS